jgi:hypothetical protein
MLEKTGSLILLLQHRTCLRTSTLHDICFVHLCVSISIYVCLWIPINHNEKLCGQMSYRLLVQTIAFAK